MNYNFNFWSISSTKEFKKELSEYLLKINELERIQINGSDLKVVLPILWDKVFQHYKALPLRFFGYDNFDLAIFDDMPEYFALENLHIEVYRDIMHLEKLANFNHLKSLFLDFGFKKEATDLSFVATLPADLEQFYLGYNEKSIKTDLSPLGHFKYLKTLSLKCVERNLESILPKFHQLEQLHLRSVSKLKSLDCIQHLTQLKSLVLQIAGFENLQALTHLKNVEYLQLWRLNKINNLDFVSQMHGLQFLFIETLNDVNHFPKVADLNKLRRVKITSCKNLNDFSEIANSRSLQDVIIQNATQMDLTVFLPIICHNTIKNVGIGYEKVATQQQLIELAKQHGRKNIMVYKYPEFEEFVFEN